MIKRCVIVLSVSLFVLFFFRQGIAMNFFDSYRPSEREQAVNALLGKIAKSLMKRHPLRMFGTNVSMPGGDVRLLGLEFQICGPLTKEQLRLVMVDCAQLFLSHVNSDEKVRPSLNHYPFAMEDIAMTFFVVDLTGRDVEVPHIGTVGFWNSEITYSILQNDEKGIPVSKGEFIESYAEAVEAVKRGQEGAAQ